MIPEERVTIRKECCVDIIVSTTEFTIARRKTSTYDNLEDEVALHQAELNERALRHALEARKEAQNDRE